MLFIFSIVMFWQSFSLPQTIYSEGAAGPALFPKIWSLLIGGLSIILFLQSIAKKPPRKEIIQKDIKLALKEEKYVYFMLAASIAYILLLATIGYVVTTFIFSMVSIKFLGSKQIQSPLSLLSIAAALTAGTYLLFAKILKVFLPTGIFDLI